MRRSAMLAKQLVRPASLASSSSSVGRRTDLVRLPPLPPSNSSRAISSATSAAALGSSPTSSMAGSGLADPSRPHASEGGSAAVDPARVSSTAPATAVSSTGAADRPQASSQRGEATPVAISAGPATEAASPPAKKAVVRDTNRKKLPPGETTGQEVPPKAPRKRGGSRYKKKQHLERPEVVEADSFLPAEWVKEIEDGVEDYQRQEAEAVIAKLERQALRKLKAMSRPNTEKQNSAQAKEKVYAVRRLHAAQAAHRIIDGALKEGRELKQLVDEANTWIQAYETEQGLNVDHTHTISSLRTDLIRHAHFEDHLTDASGQPLLDAAGTPRPGHFWTLLREDQPLWDRLVEDPGFLSELESFDIAIDYLYDMKAFRGPRRLASPETPKASGPAEQAESTDFTPSS